MTIQRYETTENTLDHVRFFGNNFDAILKEADLLTVKEGLEPGIVGLLSGLESQSKLSQLLEEVFVVNTFE